LDTQSEEVAQNALDKASTGQPTFVIAHRLSTVKHADRVYVGDGSVLESGTYAQLLAQYGKSALCHPDGILKGHSSPSITFLGTQQDLGLALKEHRPVQTLTCQNREGSSPNGRLPL
jgi:hypothetical protein